MQLYTPTMGAQDARDPGGERSPSRQLVGGVLVCGGRSRRMGQDKAQLLLDGRSFLERAAGFLRAVCGPVVLACGERPRYAELDLPLALDRWSDAGPLAGVVAGLEALETERALVIACDMPRLSRELLVALLERARDEDLDACFLSSERGKEPLCAVYSRRCLPAMRRCLDQGRRRVTAFLDPDPAAPQDEHLRVGQLQLEALPAPQGDLEVLTNVNTPEELARERRAREDGR